MSEFLAPEISTELKNLETKKLEGLFELFTKLNYNHVAESEQPIPFDTKTWNEMIDGVPIKDHIEDLRRIAEYKEFKVIFCQLDQIERRIRVERAIGKKLINDYKYCLVIFTDPPFSEYHFVNIKWDEKNEKRNIFRRLVIDDFDKIRTAIERIGMISLIDKNNNIREFEAVELMKIHDTAFDVEAVTEQFFEVYKKILGIFRESFMNQEIAPEKICHEFAQLFFNRMMFLYFIQKKKWLNNDKKYLRNLFEKYNKSFKSRTSNFYNDFLKPLFFESFNNSHKYEKYNLPPEIKKQYENMPFLNGGLFEETEIDLLGFVISDDLVKILFQDLLDKYNFTIKEDSPIDQELAIDPEMLGKVYESLLLGEERGESGIFYTPRIEIDFMCKQSLFHLIKSKIEIEEELLIKILYDIDFMPEKSKKIEELKELLENIKIADPACGSGSFLVGMLNILYGILRRIYFSLGLNINQLDILKKIIFTSLYGVDIKKWAIEVAKLRIWLRLIVDIELKDIIKDEPILPNFFYKIRQGDSLIQRLGSDYLLLPNDFIKGEFLSESDKNIIKDLIELKKNYFFHITGRNISEVNRDIKDKSSVLYRNLINGKINELKSEISKLKTISKSLPGDSKRAVDPLKKEKDMKINEYNNQIDILKKLSDNLEKHIFSTLFLWELDFIEVFSESGFDIIIGNPPYLRQEEIKPIDCDDEKIIEEYKEKLIQFVEFKWKNKLYPKYLINIDRRSDYLIYFYYFGLNYVKENGILCFITSNAWLDVQYGYPFQEFLLKNTNILEVIDNKIQRSFEHADINTVISIIKKPTDKTTSIPLNIVKFIVVNEFYENFLYVQNLLELQKRNQDFTCNIFKIKCLNQLELYFEGIEENENTKQQKYEDIFKLKEYTGNKWSLYLRSPEIFFDILKRGKKIFTKLGKIAEIKFGIKTGANEFFYLDENEIKKWQIEADYLKPVLKSPKECKKILIHSKDINSKIFMCHKSKKELSNTYALKYIEYGEKKEIEVKQGKKKGQKIIGYQNINSIKNKTSWYDLGKRDYPDAIWVKSINDIHGQSILNGDFYTDQRFYEIYFKEKYDIYTQIFLINNIFLYLNKELYGRINLGDGVLDTAVFEAEKCYVIKPSEIKNIKIDFSPDDIYKSVFEELGIDPSIPIRNQKPNPNKIREQIDKPFFDLLNFTDNEKNELYWSICEIINQRLKKSKTFK